MIHRFIFYVLVLLLPVQLGYHVWPVWTQVLGRRIDYLSPTLYLTDILIVLTFALWLLQTNVRATKNEMIFGSVLLCFALLNSFFSMSPPVALYAWAKVTEYCLLVWYIVRTKPDRHVMMVILSVSLLYSSAIAIVQFVLQHSIGGLFWFLGERTFSSGTPGIAQASVVHSGLLLRAYGTFPHPNVFGGFLAITVPLVMYHFYSNRTSVRRSLLVFGWFSVSSGIIALVLTFSRTAWVIFVIGLIALFKKKQLLIPAVLFAVCVTILTILPLDESVQMRQELAVSAVKIWSRHPLFGAGLGNFIVALPAFLPSRLVYFLQPVHSIYLLILSETGVIGVIGLLVILWKLRRRITISWPVAGLLLIGLVDHYPVTLQQGQLLMALFLGLIFIHDKKSV